MYAVIVSGGKQHRVKEGETLKLEKLEVETGGNVEFDRVLLIADGDEVQVGAPVVDGAKVTAKVVDQYRAKKVIAFKFKRRKGYHKTKGHRRHLTRLEIVSV